jgi:hypothetical protein
VGWIPGGKDNVGFTGMGHNLVPPVAPNVKYLGFMDVHPPNIYIY